MNKEIIGGYLGTAVSAVGTAIQFDDILRYISLGITILGGLITLISQLVIWYKKAKADGKITKEEIEEGAKIIQSGVENIKDRKEDTK